MRLDKYKTPDWLLTLDCLAFIVMGSVSIIQNTIFLRNMALTVGAGIGAYLVYRNRHNLMSSKAYPIALIALLFLWMLLHYLFFSTDVASQYRELTGIWKRILLAFIFALGLGLSVSKASRFNLYLILVGFGATIIVYYLRLIINAVGLSDLSIFFTLNYLRPELPQYIPKYYLTVFVMPMVAIAYYGLSRLFASTHKYKHGLILLLIVLLAAALYIFYKSNNRNGVLYFLCITLFFLGQVVLRNYKKFHFKNALFLVAIALLLVTAFKSMSIIQRNGDSKSSWSSYMADAKVAINFDRFDRWKYSENEDVYPYPENEYGVPVNPSNYDRVAWGIKGVELAVENPLGYGLLINSFGELAKKKWPESTLNHSHSGWIDLALGLGIPGLLLILASVGFTVANSRRSTTVYGRAGAWVLLAMCMVFVSSEAAERILFDYFVFLITFFAAITVNSD